MGTRWISGVVWGSPHADGKPDHATQLEFNISPTDNPSRDFYDVSLVVSRPFRI